MSEITLQDRLEFLNRQRRIRGSAMIPNEAFGALTGDAPDASAAPRGFMDTIMGAFGEPVAMEVAGVRLRIDSPTVDGVLRFISEMQALERKQPEDMQDQTLNRIKALMADSLEFLDPETAPADVETWIGKLRARQFVVLLKGFTEAFDFKALMRHVEDIRGKAAALGGRASPGRN